MKSTTPANTNKINSVEGVRGIACFMVLLSHLSLIFFPYLHGENIKQIKTVIEPIVYSYPLGLLYSGTAAVYIFFSLSGFILTYACVKKGNALDNATKMLSCRYIRLALPTFTSIIISAVVIYLFRENASGMPWIGNYGSNVSFNVKDVFINSVFSSVLTGNNAYNWVVWTMQIEFFGSVLIFMAVPLLNNFKYTWIILIVFGVLITINYPTKNGYGYAAFLFGSALYYLPSIKNNIIAIITFVAGFYFGGFHYKQGAYSYLIEISNSIFDTSSINYYYFYNMLSGVFIVYSLIKFDIFNFLTENKISVWLGKVSFSAYLVQMPIYLILTPISSYLINNLEFNYLTSALLTSIACICCIYLVSTIFYRYVDLISVKISKKGTIFINNSKAATA